MRAQTLFKSRVVTLGLPFLGLLGLGACTGERDEFTPPAADAATAGDVATGDVATGAQRDAAATFDAPAAEPAGDARAPASTGEQPMPGTLSDGGPTPASTAEEEPTEAADAAAAPCRPGAQRCDAGNVWRCSDAGAWQVQQQCSDGTTCLESTKSCGTCAAGEQQCADANTLAVCSNGQFVEQDCAAPTAYCEQGQCRACSPEASAAHCEGNAPVLCVGGDWQTQPLCSGEAPLCDDATGVCVACDPETATLRCRDNALEQCNVNKAWEVSEACEAGSTCLEASGTCGTCTEGEAQCSEDGLGVVTCNAAGEFVLSDCPPDKPVCSGAECVPCTAGVGPQQQCVGNTPQLCSSNAWVSQATCEGYTPQCNPDTGRCECEEGAAKCLGAELYTCVGGEWVFDEECEGEFPLCTEHNGCACEVGSTLCTDDDRLVRTCDGFGWDTDFCPAHSPVCAQDACYACVPGSAATCEEPVWDTASVAYVGGRKIEFCTDEIQVQETPCDFICNAGVCKDTRELPGQFTCNLKFGPVCTGTQACCGEQIPRCVEEGTQCGSSGPGSSDLADRFTCDGHNDCGGGGRVCCHHLTGGTFADLITCEEPDNCADTDPTGGNHDRVVCGPNDPCVQGTCEPFYETGISHCVVN